MYYISINKEIKEMKLYRGSKKITKKEAIEWLGEERFNTRIEDAKEAYREDPNELISWMDGFRVEF